MLTRALILLAPVLLGVAAGAGKLFAKPDDAVAHLNRYALYFAFPALVFGGIVDARFVLPSEPVFWLLVPVVLLIALALIRLLARPRREAGSMALIASFGNVAYLGLPVIEQTLGSQALGAASLAVAIFVTFSMVLGPGLLLRWSGRTGSGNLRKVLRQPLLWAPIIGLLARALPAGIREDAFAVAQPLGHSAAPVALFLLGLYLHTHAHQLQRFGRSGTLHVGTRLLLMPALMLGACWVGRSTGALQSQHAQIFFILASMPAAITTFAIAQEMNVGMQRVSQTIVVSTLLSAGTIPLTIWIALRVL